MVFSDDNGQPISASEIKWESTNVIITGINILSSKNNILANYAFFFLLYLQLISKHW